MVKVIIISLLVSVACISGYKSIAQNTKTKPAENKYRAVHWGLEEGLGTIRWHTAMLKDIHGFMWFGSQHGELSRFDGSNFKQYYPDKNKPGTIKNISCHALVEDSLHNIWIGTSGGLSRYDIKADTFTNFSASVDPVSLYEFAFPFWATRDEVFCYEPGVPRIISYDIRSFKSKTIFKIEDSLKMTMGYLQGLSRVFDSASNSIWMLLSGEEGLIQFSLATGKTIYHRRAEMMTKADSWGHKDAEAMCYDRKRNCIWINSQDGLTQFTLHDKKFHHIPELNSIISLKGYARWVGIDVDPAGRIWLATIPKGILIYDPLSHSVTTPFADTALQKKVAYGNAKIYCDRDGIVWCSYWSLNEIYQLIPYSPAVQTYTANPGRPDSLSSLSIHNMVGGEQGELWIGTDHGLNIFNPQTGSFRVLREKDLAGLKGSGIVPMVIDTISKKVWLNAGPPDRVYEMDMRSKKCKVIVFKDTLGQIIPSVNIINFASHAYKNGCLFYDAGHGIFEISGDSSTAQLVIPIRHQIFKILVAENHLMFLKTFPQRLTYQNIDGRWTKVPHIMDSIEWADVYYDPSDKTYLVAAAGEILHYNKDFHIIRRYINKAGLLESILCILPDNRGNLWFNNLRKNIGRLNLKTGLVTMLSDLDGYHKQLYDAFTAPAKEAGGNLYFTGNFLAPGISLDMINSDNFVSFPPATVYLRSLDVKGFTLPLSTGVNDLRELSLKYFQNKINIETGSIDHYSKGTNHIRYKLEAEGKNAEWQYAPAKTTINYEGLPPGEYKLIIQSSNASAEYNGPEKILHISISPAFWNTWWFRVIALLLLVDLIYTFVQWRTKQKFKLKLERSEKERQVAELQQQKTQLEMQALRAQMNPHFIFNSLNSINRFILQNNREQASEYLTKFSKLVRLILQNSQASLITLENELEALSLYLDLEALRFDHRFGYKISVPKDLDIEVLKVPPLIIQPYTENAIWHGLMHKEDKGQLDVEVSQEEEYLFFKITDNGIGRKKAAEMASKSATKHKSMGLRITKDRIAMLQKTNGTESPVKIIDLENEDGTAAGTEVVIKMPAIYE